MNNNYISARQKYAEFGIDTDKVIEKISEIPLSIHSWQLDDVIGFESDVFSKPSGEMCIRDRDI